MALFKTFAAAFMQYRCECCGQLFSGAPRYALGLVQCESCAGGDHRHPRLVA